MPISQGAACAVPDSAGSGVSNTVPNDRLHAAQPDPHAAESQEAQAKSPEDVPMDEDDTVSIVGKDDDDDLMVIYGLRGNLY
jgi:hypothetical protein